MIRYKFSAYLRIFCLLQCNYQLTNTSLIRCSGVISVFILFIDQNFLDRTWKSWNAVSLTAPCARVDLSERNTVTRQTLLANSLPSFSARCRPTFNQKLDTVTVNFVSFTQELLGLLSTGKLFYFSGSHFISIQYQELGTVHDSIS